MLPNELGLLCQMATGLLSHGPPKAGSLWKTLLFLATQLGLPITSEECQIVCSKLGLDWGYETQANPMLLQGVPLKFAIAASYYQPGHPYWVPLQAPSPSEAPRTISLPLDRRKGGEIHLSEEQAQLAMSREPEEGSDMRPRIQYGLKKSNANPLLNALTQMKAAAALHQKAYYIDSESPLWKSMVKK